MKITEITTIQEIAAIVCQKLEDAGIETFLSTNKYMLSNVRCRMAARQVLDLFKYLKIIK